MESHHVGVGGLVMRDNRLLLVKRNRPPFFWAPPGGRLKRGEDPALGLRREIFEECRLRVNVICPMSYWYGPHEGVKLLAIFFLCELQNGGEVILSDESSVAAWFTLMEIKNLIDRAPSDIFGKYQDYERAVRIYNVLSKHPNADEC